MKTIALTLLLIVAPLCLRADRAPDTGLVAHEWGTFTSVQGSDGIQIEWNPLVTSELPSFVYNTTKPSGDPRRRSTAFGAKTAFRTLQRMETPVIYFYSDTERTVNVTVKFPQGLITEWYPQARDIGPSAIQPRPVLVELDKAVAKTGLQPGFTFASLDTKKGIAESLIRWTDLKILPARTKPELAPLLPADKSGSHYYAARETDADFLRVNALTNGGYQLEHEKFLFYRGLGNFQTPLQLTTGAGEDYIQLHNTGVEDLANLFVLQVRAGQGKFIFVDRLAAGESKVVKLEPNRNLRPLAELVGQISARMTGTLVQEGLFEREAEAMVNTWRDSWFEEQGLRVLYTLPRSWTDRILPLAIEPPPRELVRVMVGRAEWITPSMEWELLKLIVRYTEADEAARPQIVENVRKLGLGRFAEATTRRLMSKLPIRQFSQISWELLETSAKPAPAALARK